MRFRQTYPLLIVAALEGLFMLYLIVGHRGVIGHDSFAYFNLQYYFLNNAVNSGENAQWMPFLAHGFVANWWYSVQAGILQSAMLAFGELNKTLGGWNFLPIYYVGIFFELIVFAIGVYLLGQRYFQSRLTILFVEITSVGSATWFTTVFSNLHFYFTLPLIFHLIHVLFETGRWRYLFFAANLFVVQILGDAPYFLPFLAFVVVLYTLFYSLFFRKKALREVLHLLRNPACGIVSLALVGLFAYFLYGSLTYGTGEIINYDSGRAPNGRNVSLDSFLTYGTNSNFRWAELVTRISPVLDYNLYFGYLPLAFCGIALFTRRNAAFLMVACTTLVLFLVANSTPVASLLYYIWPGMQFFRHLSLVSTIVRMLICFMAGFGFEAVMTGTLKDEQSLSGRVRMSILLLFSAAAGLFKFSYDFPYARGLLFLSSRGTLPLDWNVFEPWYLPDELFKASLWCLAAAGFFAVLLLTNVSRQRLAIAAILFQALDIYSFRFDLSRLRTIPLTQEEYDISRFQPVPYSQRREPVDYATHYRGKNVPQKKYRYGEMFWTADLLTFADSASNSGRTDQWLLPFDDFLRTYSGEAIRDFGLRPQAFRPGQSFKFPFDNSNAQKAAGVTEDKIQFFSSAHFLPDDRKISTIMASKEFRGDVLLLSGLNQEGPVSLDVNERVQRSHQILQYDSNDIKIQVESSNRGDWLYYADCWHPFWSVTVNGNDVPYYKANLAYKAVQLEQGNNLVHFRFYSSRLAFFTSVLNWNALAWLALPFYFIRRAPLLLET